MLTVTLLILSQIGAPQGVRLLDDAPWVAQAAPPLVPSAAPASDAQVSVAQLKADIETLKKARPGLGAGIALVSTGGTASLIGALYLVLSTVGSFGGMLNPFVVLGALGLGVGLPLVVIGVWLLYNRIEERNRIDPELKVLKEQLRNAPSVPSNQPRSPKYSPDPSMSDPPPPQVRGPDSTLLLAAF